MRPDLELKRFARDGMINFFRFSATVIFSGIVSILIARILGVEGRGAYVIATTLPTMLYTLSTVGLLQSMTYYVAGEKYSIPEVLWNGIALSLGFGLFVVMVGHWIVAIAGAALFPGVSPELLLLALWIIPLLHLQMNLSAIFNGQQDYLRFGAIHLSRSIAMTVLFIGLVGLGYVSVRIAILVNIAAGVLALIIAFGLLSEYVVLPLISSLRLLSWSVIRELLGYGSKIYLNVIIMFLVLQSDIFLLNIMGGGVASVGIYSIAVVLAQYVMRVASAFQQLVFPRVASWKDDERRTQFTATIARHGLWLSILIAVFIAATSGFVIPLLFGEVFRASVIPLLVLLPGTVILVFGQFLGADIAARGQAETLSLSACIVLVINFVMNIILIPRYDYIGAALASTVAYTFHGIIMSIIFCRIRRIRWTIVVLPTAEDFQRLARMYRAVVRRLRVG